MFWRTCRPIYYLWLIELKKVIMAKPGVYLAYMFCTVWSLYVVWHHLDNMILCIELDKVKIQDNCFQI